MAETFYNQIARNKRNSFALMAVFMVLFVALGLLIGYLWTGGSQWGSIAIALGAGAVAFVLTLASYYGGSSAILAMSHARRIEHADDPQLFNVVEELSIAGGIPMPAVYIIDEPAMNAFATGRDPKHACVAITAGLRSKLTRDELQGVIGHELSHVRHYDIRFAMLMAVMVGVLVMLCDVFLRSVWYGGVGGSRRRSSDREGSGGGAIMLVLMIVGLLAAILAPILARVIEMALSRQREFMADAGSVELTRNPSGLAGALRKLAGDTEPLEAANRATAGLYIVHPIKKLADGESTMFDSHPPLAERIRVLESMGA